jgi:hypothetical protein
LAVAVELAVAVAVQADQVVVDLVLLILVGQIRAVQVLLGKVTMVDMVHHFIQVILVLEVAAVQDLLAEVVGRIVLMAAMAVVD